MFKKWQAVMALFCMAGYAAAATVGVGTASVRGDMSVDGYTVNGDATVFDGSVVQTMDASAALRVAHGVEITMSKSSRGTVYGDHFVLQRGATEISAPGSFALEANGLRVTANKPDSVGIVTLTPRNAVEVAAISGSFEVRDGQGILLSNVLPGRALSFAMQAQPNLAPQFLSITGMLSNENGRYYLTSDENVKYELIGNVNGLQKLVGDKILVTGNLQPSAQAGLGGTITLKKAEVNPGGPAGGMTKGGKWMIIGTSLGGAGTVAWVIYDAQQPAASR